MKTIIYKEDKTIMKATYQNLLDIAEVDYIQQIAKDDLYFEGYIAVEAGMTYMDIDGEPIPCDYEGLEYIVSEVMGIIVTDDDSWIHEYKLEWDYIIYEPPYTPNYNAAQMQYI